MKISVSFLKSKFSLPETLKKIDESIADFIHVDLMDGVFVEEKTENSSEILSELKKVTKPLDVHLMMEKDALEKTIKEIYKLNPYRLAIPSELDSTEKYLEDIKAHNILCGIAINPDTNIKDIKKFFDKIDFVLVMSVYPGKGGQTFLENTTTKLQEIIRERDNKKLQFTIAVDGGIKKDTIKQVKQYCDTVISGSFVCMSDDYDKQIALLKEEPNKTL